MGLQQLYIAGSDAGLQLDKKPFLIPDKAFAKLENAYVWRDRVVKRQGLRILGRLQRNLAPFLLGNLDGSGALQSFLLNSFIPADELATASIVPGSISFSDATNTFTDLTKNGIITGTPAGSGTINYATGELNIAGGIAGHAVNGTFSYYPGLPVMGIPDREISAINDEQTIFFDTKYAYVFVGTAFQEFIAGTTWKASDSDFFWSTNYRGSTPESRLFFTTDFVNDGANPMRYTDGTTWTTFQPIIADNPPSAAQSLLYQAEILIPYYGRLLALNTWEGTTAGTFANAVNIFNRCRFSQIGNPVAADAWRSDQFGKGGFIDAPTNEAIISAIYFKNTLIVYFERSTWQLRYVGEYGLPFIWERISSDFGSESKMSVILFDQGVAAVGDKAIISSNSLTVTRIDQQIPDVVFTFRNAANGIDRVHGVRDFQRQLVFWNYSDSNLGRKFPNKVLVYNYMNQTYAIFRDNVTAFGTFQPDTNITWDSLDTFWDDDDVKWDDVDTQSLFPNIVIGNQEGYVHYYGYNSLDDPSLSISAITLASPNVLTIKNHNLESGEIIMLTGLLFINAGSPVATNLNNRIFQVTRLTDDTISLSEWNGTTYIENYAYTPAAGTYVGGGQVTIFPKMDIQTKDFNPFQQQSQQVKLAYIDFLTDVPGADTAMTVKLLLNTAQTVVGNVIVGNKNVEQNLPAPYYLQGSDYAWHRFFATTTGQYIRIELTYDDNLMNTLSTHTTSWVLNAMALYVKPAGRNVF
jgi:hypothetical protein